MLILKTGGNIFCGILEHMEKLKQFLYKISFGNSFIKLEFVTHNQWGIGFISTTASFN